MTNTWHLICTCCKMLLIIRANCVDLVQVSTERFVKGGVQKWTKRWTKVGAIEPK